MLICLVYILSGVRRLQIISFDMYDVSNGAMILLKLHSYCIGWFLTVEISDSIEITISECADYAEKCLVISGIEIAHSVDDGQCGWYRDL